MAIPSQQTNNAVEDLSTRSIAGLLVIYEEHSLAHVEEQEDTKLLFPPVPEEAIVALQTRMVGRRGPLAVDPDYLAFLRVSNGLGLHERDKEGTESSDKSCQFYDVSEVSKDDCVDFHLFRANPVLHPLPDNLRDKFNFKDGVGIDIGPAGDEGNLWMFGPDELALAIEQFDRDYATLMDTEKQQLDDLIARRYGSQQAMRQHRFTIMEFYHWSPVVKIHLGFRTYLLEIVRMIIEGEDPHAEFM